MPLPSKVKTLLIVPPFPERTYAGRTMSIEYLAASLIKKKFEVLTFDADVWGTAKMEKTVLEFQPNIVGITNMSFQADIANAIAKRIREILPNCLIVKGGSHETCGGYQYSLGLHGEYVDIAVLGEGEKTFEEIVENWQREQLTENLEKINGIAFHHSNDLIRTSPRPCNMDIDTVIPLRNNHHPSYNFDIFDQKKTAQVMTIRGCTSKCFYCFESANSNPVRIRSEESLRAELEILKREKFEAIYFDTPTFTNDPAHVNMICRLMKEYGFIWGCNTRVDAINRAMVLQMADAGCVYIFCGVESLIPGVLLGINKTRDPEQYILATKQAYQWLQEAGIPRSVFLIFGGPKVEKRNGHIHYGIESKDDIEMTLRLALYELNPDFLSMNILRLLPDVPLSNGKRFSYIRPGDEEIHAGFYDAKWLEKSGKRDYRSRHDIFRAFEGRFSVNSKHMTVERCYDILQSALKIVNEYQERVGKEVKIVVGEEFEERYITRNYPSYKLAPLNEMKEC